MSTVAPRIASAPAEPSIPSSRPLTWLGAVVAFVAFWQFGEPFAAWAFDYPKSLVIPAARWINITMEWLLNDATFGLFTFTELTRFIAAVINVPYQVALSLLSTGFLSGQGSSAVQIVPPLSWIAVIGIVTIFGWRLGGKRLAALVAVCFGFLAIFGQWDSGMVTLASILVAVPLGVAGGLLAGIRSLSLATLRKGAHTAA